ncbi:hypothetical protein GBW32_10035 [Streptomyces tsukubensis]|uniref:Uncharacterized protein n=1 Tax=Streptomyces tsukubensis TaxID=83656 RepID=A0A1V4A5H1_9ACTN|nr:hypothetical protein B1H18_20320 [Streptomyces tsukubensis]QFR93362.1 hypothetical protein GBW32_10035 [Streptomyces tsukubensis]
MANRPDRCGVRHQSVRVHVRSCDDTARNVTVSAVSAAGYLRDPSRPCGLRPMPRARAWPKTSSEK